jgi:hypothetical protein
MGVSAHCEIVALKSLRQFFHDGYFNPGGCHKALHVMTWRAHMAAAMTAKRRPVPMTVRVKEELLRQLQESAKDSFRSVNAEINHRLRSSLERKTEQPSVA